MSLNTEPLTFYTHQGKPVILKASSYKYSGVATVYLHEPAKPLTRNTGTLALKMEGENDERYVKVGILVNRTVNQLRNEGTAGVGFFLMKQAIAHIPSCHVHVLSSISAVFFYWKLGFKPESEMLEKKLAALVLKQENPQWTDNVKMHLPAQARKAWQQIIACDPLLNEVFERNQKIIQLIDRYLLA